MKVKTWCSIEKNGNFVSCIILGWSNLFHYLPEFDTLWGRFYAIIGAADCCNGDFWPRYFFGTCNVFGDWSLSGVRFVFHVFFVPLPMFFRKGAGVADRGGLENRCTFGYPGFESLPLRWANRTIPDSKQTSPTNSMICGTFLFPCVCLKVHLFAPKRQSS